MAAWKLLGTGPVQVNLGSTAGTFKIQPGTYKHRDPEILLISAKPRNCNSNLSSEKMKNSPEKREKILRK